MKTLNPELYPKFRTKANKLTAYAFICGYVEEKDKNGVNTKIWRDGGCDFYHIRRHDFNSGKRIFWEYSKTLAGARKILNRK